MTRKTSTYARKRAGRTHYVKTYDQWSELTASATEPISADKRTYQLLRMWEGFVALKQEADPSTDAWRMCSDAVNLMETLVLEMRVAEDPSGLLMDAVTALAMAGRRNRQGHPIRLDGPGIQAVQAVLEDYAALLEVLPARTVVRAHRLTEQRIHEILAGKRRPHDVEVINLETP
jgi:hypothetical protein